MVQLSLENLLHYEHKSEYVRKISHYYKNYYNNTEAVN